MTFPPVIQVCDLEFLSEYDVFLYLFVANISTLKLKQWKQTGRTVNSSSPKCWNILQLKLDSK